MACSPYFRFLLRYFQTVGNRHITKRLRGIWHAWHFYYALSFVFKALCGNFVLRACTP
ncbi:DUF3265 domain-containing protein [Vibrio parahaemolyticus]|nr:DUF3265 domain-containing protein [Vibrio parahaemolyticus]MCI9711599.1 DUF3265 domain-containing protein [Vibrio parahaemolyticus]MCI9716457.1 DUF3265 domain-containing protein [Vibrio parahaemolyticus]TMX54458.1 DUF3265 domain-containing protein [Vibrio alginolyticus]HBC3426904.1 DUF3265 domain-containing protein [Vibrio parahaemolyticus]